MRISTYRDVYSGEIHYLRSYVRMGGQGSIVDNAHAGGVFVGIDDDGKLMKYACNQYGNKYNEHNGIDFSKKDFTIPNWENVKAFALQVSNKFIHHSLFGLDVVLDKNNTPKLLEVNVQGFGGWSFQFTSGTCFRQYTDDVIEYCFKEIKKVQPKIILGYRK